MNQRRNANFGLMIVPIVVLMFFTAQLANAHHVDDRFGILISVYPQKYNFDLGEAVIISGEVHGLRNGSPVILKVFNPKNSACNFQQLSLGDDMRFKAQPIKLGGILCGIEGEYKITAYYGRAKALTKFNVAGYDANDDDLTGGKAEVINAQTVSNFLKADNRYPVDLTWASNAVLLRNNLDRAMALYLVFAEFDAEENTRALSVREVTLEPKERKYVVAPSVPQIIDGRPDRYLHVFAWTALDKPTPLHPGLYIPY